MNYKQKYIKYKKKYIQLKNIKQIGGNDLELIDSDGNRIDLNTNTGRDKVKAGRDLYWRCLHNDLQDVIRLGPKKIIGSVNNEDFIDGWKNLDELNKKYLTKILIPEKIKQDYNIVFNFEIDIFIKDVNSKDFQYIIFYLPKYLDLLVKASNKTREELLTIFSKQQGSGNPLYTDLIKIAFGDVFGNGNWGKKELETCEGKFILIIYLDLLKKLEN